MRVLFYGLQSSGASFVTWCHALRRDTIAIPDLWINFPAPCAAEFPGADVILKATIGTRWSLDSHMARFQPDRMVLVVRDLAANIESLCRKPYRNHAGTVSEKASLFRRLDRSIFDEVICYEDFAAREQPSLRSLDEIRDYNCFHSEWCRRHFGRGWGFGGIRDN